MLSNSGSTVSSLTQSSSVPQLPLDIIRLIVAELDCQLEDASERGGSTAMRRSAHMLSLMTVCRGWKLVTQPFLYAHISELSSKAMYILSLTLSRKRDVGNHIRYLSVRDYNDDIEMEIIQWMDYTLSVLLHSKNLRSFVHPAPLRPGLCNAVLTCNKLISIHIGVYMDVSVEEILVALNYMPQLEELEITWMEVPLAPDFVENWQTWEQFPVGVPGLTLSRLRRFAWIGDVLSSTFMAAAALRYLSTCQFTPTCDILIVGSLEEDDIQELDPFFQRHAHGSWEFQETFGVAMLGAVRYVRGSLKCEVDDLENLLYKLELEDMTDLLHQLPGKLTVVLDMNNGSHTRSMRTCIKGLFATRHLSKSTSPTILQLGDARSGHPVTTAAFDQFWKKNSQFIRDELAKVNITLGQ